MILQRIVVRKERNSGNLIAFLPDEPANTGHVAYFGSFLCHKTNDVMARGSHGEADLRYYRVKTVRAEIAEQVELSKQYQAYVRSLPGCQDVCFAVANRLSKDDCGRDA